jgi:methyl-accepting chemotaxis protein
VNLLNTILTIVLVAAALVTVWFARQAARDGHDAATAAEGTVTKAGEIAEATRNTVSELQRLAEHSRDTVGELRRVATATSGTVEELERVAAQLEQVAEHARHTVELAREAAAASERDRKMRQLRDIAGLIETIFWKAAEQAGRAPTQWRCAEQNELGAVVAAYGEPLPLSLTLRGEGGAETVMGTAARAREEVRRAIETFGQDPA